MIQLDKDIEEWNKQCILFVDECDMKQDFGAFLIKKYYGKKEKC